MTFIRLLPVLLSGILMAAHFLRAGYTVFMAMVLLGLLLLFVKRPWAARLMQLFLVVSLLVYVRFCRREFNPLAWLVVVLGLLLSILSKTNTVIAPVMVVLLELFL